MTLPVSGNVIKFSQINTELEKSSTATIKLSDSDVRTLFGASSGLIKFSNGFGKSWRSALSYVYSVNTTNSSLDISTISGYIAGRSDVTITVNSGVYVYATSTGSPGLTISGGVSGDTVTLVNNGYILGMGGAGGDGGAGSPVNGNAGSAGGTALSVTRAIRITNNGTIAGGGGGGGGGGGRNAGDWYGGCGGGGGAPLGAGGSRGAWSGAGTGGATNGSAASLTTFGAGGPTINVSAPGGNGGAWGTVGSAGSNSSQRTGGAAGAAGNYISGNANVPWLVNGTRTGGVA
jgi:hypothetical protein